ncbi:MAG: nucleotidyltransferase family protein [Acidobacteria bacterium]|nr:nucleotidyltransferase family protein [Acidobacteriota bacterium]
MISAILLAAGESRRMGRLKQLLPFGSKTVIETCLENLLASKADEVIVVLGHRYDEVRAQIQHLPVKCVFNLDYQQGMSTSVKAGVRSVGAGAQAVLIALVDQPLVTSGIIDQLIDAYMTEGKKVVIPEFDGRSGHPILIDLAYRDEILKIDPRSGLRRVVYNHWDETLKLPVKTDAVIQNMNTWDDYQQMIKRRQSGEN